jgi:hypothetical protein
VAMLWGGWAAAQEGEIPETAPAQQQAPTSAEQSAAAGEQDAKLAALAEEVRRLKLEIGIPDVEYAQYAGMGPAASKVYFVPRGLSIGGYGEATYEHPTGAGKQSISDLLRMILYVGYRFNDRIVFNSEIEFEHAHTLKKGEVAVEFAYLDFKFTDAVQLRAGNVLMPMGIINEVHEPAFFKGVLRPDVERTLIPSTWNENGLGLFGEVGRFRYKTYLVNGLQALSDRTCVSDATVPTRRVCNTGNEGFTSGSWIRNGRQRGSKAYTENLAGVAAVEYAHDLAQVGASAYFGRSGQGRVQGGQVIKGEVFLTEAHVTGNFGPLQAKALGTFGTLGDADLISTAQNATIGSQVWGAYGELSYDVGPMLLPGGEQTLAPFVRWEGMNLHYEVPEGRSADPTRNMRVLTLGLSYKPIVTVVAKLDYQRRWSAVADSAADQVNLGMGFVF